MGSERVTTIQGSVETRLSEASSNRLRGPRERLEDVTLSELRTEGSRGTEPRVGSSPRFWRTGCLGLVCQGRGASGQLAS